MSKATNVKIHEIDAESAAHLVLNSILTKAATSKKSYKTKLKISFLELMKGIGDETSFADINLEISIGCRWVEDDGEEQIVTIEEDETGGEGYE